MKPYNGKVLLSVALTLVLNIFLIPNCEAQKKRGNRGRATVVASPEVVIPQGNLRGANMVTHKGRAIHGYMGIPFARPPLGELRFRAPVAADPWTGTRDASKDANTCIQVSSGEVIGDEDCLYLNVYIPQLTANASEPLPVMVWIYGGAFSRGTGNSIESGPGYLLDGNVILVVPNYRLGPLGFLCTGDEVSPGNYGMKDQVLALKWVQTNIEYFGGDPNQVTIFGISSGAASVNHLALSEPTEGLFQQYIKISGASLSPRAYVSKPIIVRDSYQLGEHLGCPSDTSSALVECLREMEAAKIVDTTTLFVKWDKYPDIIWRPTDESASEEAFLTDSPANLYAAGKVRDLPCISGLVRDEGLYYTNRFYENPSLFDDFLKKVDEVLPYILLYQDREDASRHTAALKAYYLNDLSADREVLLANMTQLMGDVYYIRATYEAHRKQFALGTSPQYLYSFEYLRSNKYDSGTPVPPGIQHADDEPFYFPLDPVLCAFGSAKCGMSESDWKMVDIMVSLWTTFAATGVPTLPSEYGVTWEPYSAEDNYLLIGDGSALTLEMRNSMFKDRMQFWDALAISESRGSNAGPQNSEIKSRRGKNRG